MAESVQFAEASVKRICDHMNEDHADALSHYLEYYADVKASPEDCIMTSIDKEGMEIEIRDSKDHKVVRVPFDPPLEESKEARVRLVNMAWDAVEGLGMSRYQVDKYAFSFIQGFTIFACLFMYWAYLTPQPLTPIEPFLRKHVPFYLQLASMLMPPVIHAIEAQLIMVPLLRKHRVPTKVGFKWILACLATGGVAVINFKALVAEEKQRLDEETKGM